MPLTQPSGGAWLAAKLGERTGHALQTALRLWHPFAILEIAGIRAAGMRAAPASRGEKRKTPTDNATQCLRPSRHLRPEGNRIDYAPKKGKPECQKWTRVKGSQKPAWRRPFCPHSGQSPQATLYSWACHAIQRTALGRRSLPRTLTCLLFCLFLVSDRAVARPGDS